MRKLCQYWPTARASRRYHRGAFWQAPHVNVNEKSGTGESFAVAIVGAANSRSHRECAKVGTDKHTTSRSSDGQTQFTLDRAIRSVANDLAAVPFGPPDESLGVDGEPVGNISGRVFGKNIALVQLPLLRIELI